MYFDSNRTGNYEIYFAEEGRSPVQLTRDPRFDSWWPRVSRGGTWMLFYRTPAGVHDSEYRQASLWAMKPDGTGQVQLRPVGADGWQQQGHGEWSPDGTRIVMFGGSLTNPQIFHTDAMGKNPFQVTARGGHNIDPSWSPDGQSIVFVACPPGTSCNQPDYELYVVGALGGPDARLTHDTLRDHDPYFSPDAKTIAWLTERPAPLGLTWDIRMLDGAGVRWFTHDDNAFNALPQWSADGAWIYYHRLELGGSQWHIYKRSVIGSMTVNITSGQPGNNEYVHPVA